MKEISKDRKRENRIEIQNEKIEIQKSFEVLIMGRRFEKFISYFRSLKKEKNGLLLNVSVNND